jgi:Leucine-rich repeat (LRR) protein
MKKVIVVLVLLLVIGGFIGFIYFRDSDSEQVNQNASINSGNNSNDKSSSNSVVLDLSNKGITKVTADIYDQTATTDLILSYNNIKQLPSEMGKMDNLIIFKIDHNILNGSLMAEIRKMKKLKQLDVSYNNMNGIPAEIGQLTNLQTLNYSYNKIDGLPNELKNLKNNLKILNLTGNPISQDKIDQLKVQLPTTNIIY